jgi:Pentapeptide repeats (9 copies)/Ion channel
MNGGNNLLSNLFRLDGTPTAIGPNDQQPSMSPGDSVSNIVFDQRRWVAPPQGRVREVIFRNVAFSKSTLSRITFTDCTFEDCLFLGTRFHEIEFHSCRFLNCNFWKAKFRQVYLDPDTIKLERRFKVEAANTGISVFQALLGNFAEERQDEFYMQADIRFRRWKRYQIWSELRRKRVPPARAFVRWFSSITYEGVAGFGYRPLRFFAITVVMFLAVSLLNYWVIGDAVKIDGHPVTQASLVDTIFYSFSILTVLGFSTITPASESAKLLTVIEALIAIGWLGIFTSVLVKRFLR